MKCSKCGYERQSRDDAFVPLSECPACGIVYAKHDAAKDSSQVMGNFPRPKLKPSPVDALSLRKARERVEKRLRERLETRVKDERHAHTLELAKRLTTEQVLKRRNASEQTGGDNATDEISPPQSVLGAPDREGVLPKTADPPPSETESSTEQHTPEIPAMASHNISPDLNSIEETVDSPSQTVEILSPQTDETQTRSEKDARSDIQPESTRETETAPIDEPAVAELEMHSLDEESDPQPVEHAWISSQESIPISGVAFAAQQSGLQSTPGRGMTRLLPVVAWLILFAGIIGAVLSWSTIGDVEAGVRLPIPESMSALPVGLLLGFAYLATGALGFAFFWVSSLISIQLKDIQRLLMFDIRAEDLTRMQKQALEAEERILI